MAVGRFRLPGELIAGIPTELDELVDKALAPKPYESFQDADEMSTALMAVPRQAEAGISTVEDPDQAHEDPVAASIDTEEPEPLQENDPTLTHKKRRPLLWTLMLAVLLSSGHPGALRGLRGKRFCPARQAALAGRYVEAPAVRRSEDFQHA